MQALDKIHDCKDQSKIRSLLVCCDNDCEYLTQEQHGYTFACERFGSVLHRTDGEHEREYEAYRCSACLKSEFMPLGEAIQEATAYARRCGELEAQLCAQLVEHPGRKAMLLVLEELRHAKVKYPHFANNLPQALAVLDEERWELSGAIGKGDIHGEHGVIREAAQVGAVALRIIEMALGMGEVAVQTKDVRCGTCGWWNGGELGFHIDEVRKCTAPVPASVACWGALYIGTAMEANAGKNCPCHKPEASA